MMRENPSWGAPRVHSELLLLGFELAESTVSKYLPRQSPDLGAVRRWKIFLRLHRKALVGMDFFTVPTLTFQVWHVLFFVHHHRRRVVHWAVTRAPSTAWICQQLREAFPYDTAPRFLVLDRDALFNTDVGEFIRALGTTPVRISPRSPWQNGVAERWVGSVRRELLDHVVVLGDQHLRRLLVEYVAYYHEDRPHLGLGKDTPQGREAMPRPTPDASLLAQPKVGGLHHRYAWRAAA